MRAINTLPKRIGVRHVRSWTILRSLLWEPCEYLETKQRHLMKTRDHEGEWKLEMLWLGYSGSAYARSKFQLGIIGLGSLIKFSRPNEGFRSCIVYGKHYMPNCMQGNQHKTRSRIILCMPTIFQPTIHNIRGLHYRSSYFY